VDALYPMHRIDKVLEGLLARGYRLYVLSNCGHRFHDFEYKIPYLEQFSGIMVSAEEGVLKPSAEIFERLCERFDLKAEECVFVDDLQRNVDGARAVGMQGYCHADGNAEKLWKYLESLNG